MLSKTKNRTFRQPLAVLAFLSATALCASVSAKTPGKIYADNCAFCHSRPLPPFVAPELRGRELPPIVVKTFVRNGAKGMLTFTKADISDGDLDMLAEWIKNSPAPAMPKMPPPKGGQ